MYTPQIFKLDDRDTIIRLIKENPFGILVSGLMATHLPFILEQNDTGEIILTAHMARANPHVQLLRQESLVIFQGPHGYISPAWYERENSVPTWDYLAVHCYGTPEILLSEDHYNVLEMLIRQMEPDFLHKWNLLPEHYRSGLSKGIVAFRMKVERVDGTAKLSQNRTLSERRNIVRQLKGSQMQTNHLLADWIGSLIPQDE
jgi:transcriptional regulator